MNRDDFESLKRGLEQAQEFQQGARDGFRVHDPVDVKAIRAARRTEALDNLVLGGGEQ